MSSQSQSTNNTTNDSNRGFAAAIDYIQQNKISFVLWITRFTTMFFTLAFILPIFPSISQLSAYQKALVSNAATSALRLHQRLPPFRLTREFLGLLLVEDSAHYLLYSVIFMYNYPITLALLPIALFAFLHFASWTVVLCDKCGPRGSVGNMFHSVVENYQRNILQTVALTEIMLMPCIIFAILSGVGGIITPFIYYRFLVLRYTSRRNPYTRQMFHELRVATEILVYKPQCPAFIRNTTIKAIAVISRLAPPVVPS